MKIQALILGVTVQVVFGVIHPNVHQVRSFNKFIQHKLMVNFSMWPKDCKICTTFGGRYKSGKGRLSLAGGTF